MLNQIAIVESLQSIPPEWATFLLAIIPIGELRVALPVALTVLDLSVASALFFAVLGNLVPLLIVFYALPPILKYSETHWKWLHHVLEKHIRVLEKKHKEHYIKYGSIILFLFVAIPIPGTGVWTACALAVIFGIKPKQSTPMIVAGLLVAAMIVLFLTQGSVAAFG